MTPKEKARELVDKYETLFNYDYSKQCALIAVEEILDVIDIDENYQNTYSFFLKVKQEIEKL